MPTARVTAHTTAQILFTTPKHKKGKITGIIIDNLGTARRTITIQDVFTPDPSAGNPSPTEQTKDRVRISVGAGATAILDKETLEDLEVLGVAKAVADAIDTACVITVIYHFE